MDALLGFGLGLFCGTILGLFLAALANTSRDPVVVYKMEDNGGMEDDI